MRESLLHSLPDIFEKFLLLQGLEVDYQASGGNTNQYFSIVPGFNHSGFNLICNHRDFFAFTEELLKGSTQNADSTFSSFASTDETHQPERQFGRIDRFIILTLCTSEKSKTEQQGRYESETIFVYSHGCSSFLVSYKGRRWF